MDLADITPVILTYNEEPNIGRVLERLAWAPSIVVVDSFSTDRTLEILKGFPNVRLFSRRFDAHARQWNYGIHETGIATRWVLTLDADYVLSPAGVSEFETLDPGPEIAGYEAQFRFCIQGRPLRRSLYPGRIILFRRDKGLYYQDGHTQRVKIDGALGRLSAKVDLDDRKSIGHWVVAQDKYARLERDKLLAARDERLNIPDRIRSRRFIAPIFVLFYCLFAKRMIFEGLAGWYYTYQRVTAEILLSLYLIEDRWSLDRDLES